MPAGRRKGARSRLLLLSSVDVEFLDGRARTLEASGSFSRQASKSWPRFRQQPARTEEENQQQTEPDKEFA